MWDWVGRAETLRKTGQNFAIVTVAKCEGSTPREPGAKMIVTADEEFFGSIGGGQLEMQAIADAKDFLAQAKAETLQYPLCSRTGQCCGGRVQLLFEVVHHTAEVYIFGAGHVGQSLCHVLEGTPFQVHLIDKREEWVHASTLPSNVERRCSPWQHILKETEWSEKKSFALVMTQSHDQDLEIIHALLDQPLRYLGLIGSQVKWRRFREKLQLLGRDESELDQVICPVGLKTGGKAPREVAISVAAQLLAEYYGHL